MATAVTPAFKVELMKAYAPERLNLNFIFYNNALKSCVSRVGYGPREPKPLRFRSSAPSPWPTADTSPEALPPDGGLPERMIVDEGVIVKIVRPGTGDPVAAARWASSWRLGKAAHASASTSKRPT